MVSVRAALPALRKTRTIINPVSRPTLGRARRKAWPGIVMASFLDAVHPLWLVEASK